MLNGLGAAALAGSAAAMGLAIRRSRRLAGEKGPGRGKPRGNGWAGQPRPAAPGGAGRLRHGTTGTGRAACGWRRSSCSLSRWGLRSRPAQPPGLAGGFQAGRLGRGESARRWPKAVAGSCGGSKNTDRHPGTPQAIIRWPLPRGCTVRAGAHWHGRQDTRTRPGPQGWPFAHSIG